MANEGKTKVGKSRRGSTEKIKKGNRRLDISALAVIDNIVFNKNSAMAYYRIETDMFDYLSSRAKVGNGIQTTEAFTSLMQDQGEPLEIHYFNSTFPLDVDAWRIQMNETTSDWETPPEFYDYVDDMSNRLDLAGFVEKRAYIGVDLGTRGALEASEMNPFEAGIKAAAETFKRWFESIFAQYGEDISPSEEENFRNKEEKVFLKINGTKFRAQRVTAEEILLLSKRQFYPGMFTPYLNVSHGERYGAGDLVYELESVIENNYRWLKFEQMQSASPTSPLVKMEGYRATLSLTSFSREWDYAVDQIPFLYAPEFMTGGKYTSFARLTLLPKEKMKKRIDNKKKEMEDELKSFQAGTTEHSNVVNSNEDLASAVSDLQEMDAELTESKDAWVRGSYHIVVEDATLEGLKERIQQIKQTLAPYDIVVLHTAGDQLDLFLEQMPGDYRRVKSFDQISNLNMIAASGINIADRAGDEVATSDAVTYKDRLAITEESFNRR